MIWLNKPVKDNDIDDISLVLLMYVGVFSGNSGTETVAPFIITDH